ncbi:MAG: DNA gyrase/topoisomerase IV subunit A [Alistipes finegoldii]
MAEEKDIIGREEPLNEDASTPETADEAADETPAAGPQGKAGKFDRLTQDEGGVRKLTGMYKNWFLDYASYVILERAVPHVEDGLKPVQRRILHAMKVVDDGRYNKVANIVGQTMQYHPHGDASIKDALVQLGQKDLLIDCQGNWGNILTGDEAAAGRYIEARLSKFANEVVFNKKTTEWMLTYDGRKEEPVTLPIKFPLLLAQGSDGIAVGLASKILPHNFVELINACIAHLQGREFQLYPDFPTGGMADVSRYNDGLRGGAVKVRAKISKIDKRTLAITEIPYTTTTESIKDSIIKANDKGKIKIKKVDDNTADRVEIVIQVSPDESSDKTIDALYAFTDCEVSIAPNACLIWEDKPHFLGVSEILRRSAEHTKWLLGRELEIRLGELNEAWHAASLERIFIENKLYQLIEGSKSREEAYAAVDKGLEPFKKLLRREVTLSDVQRLTELKFIRISRYDSDKADNEIRQIEEDIKSTQYDLNHLTEYAVAYYERIRDKYGKGRERRTELREFDNIEATKVAVTNAKLYVDRAEGFFGIGKSMKDAELVCDCSDIDDVIVFTKDGRYVITKVSDKAFFEKGIYYIGVFKRNDERTIYNVLYRDGKNGPIMMKRCAIKAITRDKNTTSPRAPKSEILYMSVNPNGEAEVLKIYFKPRPRLKEGDRGPRLSTLAIKGRQSQGNLFSRYGIHKIVLRARYFDARRPERLVRRGCPPPERRRPRHAAGRVQGRRQDHRLDLQEPVLHHGLRSRPALSRRNRAREPLRSRPHLQHLLLRPLAAVLLYEAFHGRDERQDAVLPRRGGAGRSGRRDGTHGRQARNHLQGRACVAPCGRDRRGRIRGRQEPPRQGQAPDDLRRRRAALHRTRTASRTRTRTFGRRRRRRARRYALRRRCFRRSARRFRQRCGQRCGGRFER